MVLGWSSSDVFSFSSDSRRHVGSERWNLGTSELRHLGTTERLSVGTSREMGGALAPPIEHLVYISAGSSWRRIVGTFGKGWVLFRGSKSRVISRRFGSRFWGPTWVQNLGPEAPKRPPGPSWRRHGSAGCFQTRFGAYFGSVLDPPES